MRTVLLAGGGTGGHVMPAIAVGEELKKAGFNIIFGGGSGMEKRIAENYKIPFFGVQNVRFSRRNILENVKIPFLLGKGISQAKKVLNEYKTAAVFAKGGYASLPWALAAKSLNIPVVCHESDLSMGLSNKLISRFEKKTLTSFPETKGGICIGNPIRGEIFSGSKERARKKYGFSGEILLILGGSQGAAAINKCVFQSAKALTGISEVVHITGKCTEAPDMKGYHHIEYADDIADLYAAAHTVVTRGGAGALAEISSLGKRMIVIPLPKSRYSRGDQVENAEYYMKNGRCRIIFEQQLAVSELVRAVESERKLPLGKVSDAHSAKKAADIIAEIISRELDY